MPVLWRVMKIASLPSDQEKERSMRYLSALVAIAGLSVVFLAGCTHYLYRQTRHEAARACRHRRVRHFRRGPVVRSVPSRRSMRSLVKVPLNSRISPSTNVSREKLYELYVGATIYERSMMKSGAVLAMTRNALSRCSGHTPERRDTDVYQTSA